MISPSLKNKVGISIFSDILVKNKRFNETFDKKVLDTINLTSTMTKGVPQADESQMQILKKSYIEVVV